MDDRDEPLREASDLPLLFRSRMAGILALCFRTGEFADDDRAAMKHEINIYKSLRESLGTASGSLLSAQASAGNGPAWDVFQTTPLGGHPVVLWAFQVDKAVRNIVVRPVGLKADTMYEVHSAEHGQLAVVSGAGLMADGVDVVAAPYSSARRILLNPLRQR